MGFLNMADGGDGGGEARRGELEGINGVQRNGEGGIRRAKDVMTRDRITADSER